MNFKVYTIARFDTALKNLCKKYPSLKNEFVNLAATLENDPFQGISLGLGCYKIRLAIKSKGLGKSGGGRIITNIKVADSRVFLISIYDKSEKTSISIKELKELIKSIPPKK